MDIGGERLSGAAIMPRLCQACCCSPGQQKKTSCPSTAHQGSRSHFCQSQDQGGAGFTLLVARCCLCTNLIATELGLILWISSDLRFC